MRIQRWIKGGGVILTGCSLLFVLLSSAWAEPGPKAELLLRKEDPYLYGICGWCTDLLNIGQNEDWKNFSRYNLDTQTGYYLIDLMGPAGTMVTLFGAQDYSRKNGFLILVKKDDSPIAVGDLNNFPPRQWVDVNNAEGSGVYSVWYHPVENFKERIASVRWGQWWTELPPASEKE